MAVSRTSNFSNVFLGSSARIKHYVAFGALFGQSLGRNTIPIWTSFAYVLRTVYSLSPEVFVTLTTDEINI
jgi:hypothetical protein